MARPRLAITWQASHVPKRGNTSEEYEDAFATNVEVGRFGIADGASESSFAGLWAKLLVEGFSNGDAKGHRRGGWLQALQQHWSSAVDSLSLPWYAEIKRAEGAFATFLGLNARQRCRGRGTWHALAVGDSCLFQLREDRLAAAFPVFRSEDFGTRPCLLGSRPRKASEVRGQESGAEQAWASSDSRLPIADSWPQVRLRRRGRWLAGDRFLLMTDALAQWFLQQTEKGERPWQSMERFLQAGPGAMLSPTNTSAIDQTRSWGGESMPPTECADYLRQHDDFADWIERLRDQGDLKNDDVTLLVLQM